MKGVAIYVEGGGNTTSEKAALRQGFEVLLAPLKEAARSRHLAWKIVCCGGRDQAHHAFVNAVRNEPGQLSVLLVDAEGPIERDITASGRVAYLEKRDNWDFEGVEHERVHLMVQCMETWIVADPDVLERFYGQHFSRTALPVRQNLEEEPKRDIYSKLERATSDRRITKGPYGKIKHASQLLQRIAREKVAERCSHFATFTQWLESAIRGS